VVAAAVISPSSEEYVWVEDAVTTSPPEELVSTTPDVSDAPFAQTFASLSEAWFDSEAVPAAVPSD